MNNNIEDYEIKINDALSDALNSLDDDSFTELLHKIDLMCMQYQDLINDIKKRIG